MQKSNALPCKISDGKLLGGVCTGLAHYLNTDPMFVRMLFFLMTFVYGFGVLAYGLLWLYMPADEREKSQLILK